jgi:hypothetical protein
MFQNAGSDSLTGVVFILLGLPSLRNDAAGPSSWAGAWLARRLGYREEAAKTIVNGHQVDTAYLVNSGILVSYSIVHAMDAIKAFADAKH